VFIRGCPEPEPGSDEGWHRYTRAGEHARQPLRPWPSVQPLISPLCFKAVAVPGEAEIGSSLAAEVLAFVTLCPCFGPLVQRLGQRPRGQAAGPAAFPRRGLEQRVAVRAVADLLLLFSSGVCRWIAIQKEQGCVGFALKVVCC